MQAAADTGKDSKQAQQRAATKLRQWLDDGTDRAMSAGRFRDPMAAGLVKKKGGTD